MALNGPDGFTSNDSSHSHMRANSSAGCGKLYRWTKQYATESTMR